MTCRVSIARPTMQRARCPHQGHPCPEIVSAECGPAITLPTCPQCSKPIVSTPTLGTLNFVAYDTPGILDYVCGGHEG